MSEEWGTPISKEKIIDRRNRLMMMMNNYEEQLKEQLKIIDKDNRTLQQENICLREKIKLLHSIIKEVREKLLCYGETFDSKIHQEMQKELLDKINKEEKNDRSNNI